MKYNKERRLVILLSRIYDLEDCAKEIDYLVKDKNICWDVIIKYLCKTKVTGLFWSNIKKLKLDLYIPVNARRILEFYYLGNWERNKVILQEFDELIELLNSYEIRVAPLKGSALLEDIYQDLGARQLNDVDLLVSYKDKNALERALYENGYTHGKIIYDQDGRIKIDKLERMEQIIWKTKMNSLPPFYKILDNKWCGLLDVDCSFALDYQLNYDDVSEMLENCLSYNGSKYLLRKEDFFIQMCCHLYKEASNASWILLGNELNIIKFCDVREFWKAQIDEKSWNIICQKVLRSGYEKAVYFSLYFCEVIYEEKWDVNYRSDLNIIDDSFLYEFGEREYGKMQKWNKDFIERLFEGSLEEINIEGGQFPLI